MNVSSVGIYCPEDDRRKVPDSMAKYLTADKSIWDNKLPHLDKESCEAEYTVKEMS